MARLMRCRTYFSAMYAVIMGEADAASALEDVHKMSPFDKELKTIAPSAPIPYRLVFARKGLDPKVRKTVVEAFVSLKDAAAWKHETGFIGDLKMVPAIDSDYDEFRKYLAGFEVTN